VSDAPVWLGFDVGGTTARAAAHDGSRLSELVATRTPATYDAFLEALCSIARQALDGRTASAAVAGLPGTTGERSARWVPSAPFLDHAPLARDLERELGLERVALANDAQLALLGEAWCGAARGASDAVLVTVGTGVGGAFMSGGSIVRGAHGSAGSFGWLPSGPDEEPDPGHGPLERRASGRTLDALGAALHEPRTGPELVELARRRNLQAAELVATIGRRLGSAIAAVASILDSEVVVVAGGLSEAFDLLEPAIAGEVARRASPDGRRVPVRAAALGQRSGVVGAVRAASLGRSAWS